MRGDKITLYFPGDGVRENSNSATYKGIKDFKCNNDGTITFKTVKYGTIVTPLPWRLSQGVELKDEAGEGEALPNAPAGNQARRRGW